MNVKPVVVGEGTKYPLKALVTLPDTVDQPVPAVVFVHGSGASNMDEQVGKLAPFRDLAEGLAAHGIASIRYDKRSLSHAREMMREMGSALTVKEETIDDAILAADMLRQEPQIDPERIFIVGHSMGGMLAPRIDAEGGDFRGIIIMAGTLRKLEEVLVEQNEQVAAEVGGLTRWIVSRQVAKLKKMFSGLYELSDEEAKRKKSGGGTTLYYFKEMGQNLMPDYLKGLSKSVLIMQGAKDCQVKADVDFAGYRALLEGKDNVSFRMYEDLNHCFVPAIYGGLSNASKDYGVERHIGEDVIADVARWIHGA